MKTASMPRKNQQRSWIAEHRIAISRLYFVPVIALVLCSTGTFATTGATSALVDALAFSGITIAALGRLWCSIYISGYKTHRLIDEGPYSAVRNPLYVFSFCGGIGAALVTHSLLVLGAVMLFFVLVYPSTVRDEERQLRASLGDAYERYHDATPAFLPDRTRFHRPPTWVVNLPKLERAFLDAIWFFIGFALLHAMQVAKTAGSLPTLLSVP